MKFSMSEQEKGNILIQVTAWADLTVHVFYFDVVYYLVMKSLVF